MSTRETLINIEKRERELWAVKAREIALETIGRINDCRYVDVLKALEYYVATNSDPAVMGAHGLDMDYVFALISGLKADNLIEADEDNVLHIKE